MFETEQAARCTPEKLRERLRAALRQPVRKDEPAPVRAVTEAVDLRSLGGHWFETRYGPGYRLVSRYDASFVHGTVPLYEVLRAPLEHLARLAKAPAPQDISHLRFIDAETTGLAGAGTMVFLAGTARFEGTVLVLTQYLLPGPEYEGGLLGGLAEELADIDGIVSYNGRSFDAPMLESRYVLQRLEPRWRAAPHFDLLHVSRRVFAEDLPSHRLVEVEARILGFERDDDLPSHEVPERYFRFQRTGDPSHLLPVLRHNAWDVLSLVALLGRLGAIARGEGEPLQRARAFEHAGDHLAAARAYEEAASDAPRARRRRALERAARAYSRAGRPWDAVRCWEALAVEPPGRFLWPWIEAARVYERQLGEFESALRCTERAWELLAAGLARPGARGSGTSPSELARRLERLRRSIRATGSVE